MNIQAIKICISITVLTCLNIACADFNADFEDEDSVLVAQSGQDWHQFELEAFDLINIHRARGLDCGSRGYFPPVDSIDKYDILRNSAITHSEDMAINAYFSHTNLKNESPTTRMINAGYTPFSIVLENIAGGQRTPKEAVDAWIASDGHCAVMMNAEARHIGIGYHFDENAPYKHYWTLNAGAK
jgi:uncharacterized protein YkwD